MARRLAEAGFEVAVWARRPEPAAAAMKHGARVTATLEELGATSDVLLTVLPNLTDVVEVVTAALPGLRPGALVLDCSTVDPGDWRTFAEQLQRDEFAAVDAPVTGGDVGAQAGTLTAMCGGDAEAVERAREVLAPLTSSVIHVGAAGAGQIVKAANQVQAAASLLGMAEALVLAAKGGVDPELVIDVLGRGAARCWAIENRGPRVIRRDFEPGFRVALHRKDLGIALELAREVAVPLPVAAQAREALSALVALGQEDDDVSALVTLYERNANVEVHARGNQADGS
jgi:3-hydroxyisobutyrate dehydrogenase-like beta-hydroxyacid dehydrogenase